MKYSLLILILTVLSLTSEAQKLSIEETIDYLNEKLKLDGEMSSHYHFSQIEVNEDGYITKNTYSYRSGSDEISGKTRAHILDLERVSLVKYADDFGASASVKLKCKMSSCVLVENLSANASASTLRNNYNDFSFYINSSRNIDKIKNALDYLMSELLRKIESTNDFKEDPFSDNNFNKSTIIYEKNSSIPLESLNNVYFIKVQICGIPSKFIFDSGASDVLISESIEKNLIENNFVSKLNYLSPSLYRIADGSIVQYRRLIIPEIKVGDLLVKNVIACVSSDKNTLLLGQSFLERFSSWTIDNNKPSLSLKP